MTDPREIIARRAALELSDGQAVSLGIGIPTLVPGLLEPGVSVITHSDQGILGIGPPPEDTDPDFIDSGGAPASVLPGGALFDSAFSFALVRGSHLDAVILGAYEVDQQGSFSSWMMPGRAVPGMGGAMDLATGAKRVIITMLHTSPKGIPKLVDRLQLPMTAYRRVDTVVTELAVIGIDAEGFWLKELHPNADITDVRQKTGAFLRIPPGGVPPMRL